MKIHRLFFENFRTFRDKTEFGKLSSVNTLIGANSAGKSNVIEFLKFLRSLAENKWSRPFSELTFDRKDDPIYFEIELELEDDEIDELVKNIPNAPNIGDYKKEELFKFVKYTAQVSSTRCLDERLYVWARDLYVHVIYHLYTPQNNTLERKLVNMNTHFDSERGDISGFLSKSPAGGSNINTADLGILHPVINTVLTEYFLASKIQDFFKNIKIFGAFRKANTTYQGDQKRILLESGENVIEVMSTILGDDRETFDDIMKNYNEILGSNLTVNVPLAKTSNDIHTVTIKEEDLESQTDFLNMSTGFHQALILVLAIKQASKNQIICIEEPEIHLHSSAQKRLFKLIFDQSKTNQFFITTHSPIFTRTGSESNTFLITRNGGISELMLIEKHNQLKFIRQQIGIRNSDFFGNDYVIFVEGESEEIAVPIVAKALGHKDVGVEYTSRICVINLKGNGIIPNLRNFLDYLKNTETGIFLIADGDKAVGKSISDFIREGRILENHQTIWKKEFEDTFESNFIIKALENICKKKGLESSLSSDELDKKRDKKKVGKILEEHFHKNKLGEFSKTELATELANMISKNIKSKNNLITVFETKVKDFLEKIKEEDDSLS